MWARCYEYLFEINNKNEFKSIKKKRYFMLGNKINEESLDQFFKDPLLVPYLRYSENTLKTAVSEITAYCSMIDTTLKRCGKKEARQYPQGILSSCRKMLRDNMMAHILASPYNEIVNVNVFMFLGEFAASCQNVCNGKFEFHVAKPRENATIIKCNLFLIRYLLLRFLRKFMDIKNEKPIRVTLVAQKKRDTRKKEDRFMISLRVGAEYPIKNVDIGREDTMNKDDVALVLREAARRSNILLSESRSSFDLLIAEPMCDVSNVVEMYYDNSSFSIYNVLLNDTILGDMLI